MITYLFILILNMADKIPEQISEQLCGGEEDEDREYNEWQLQQSFEKTSPKVLEENRKFLDEVMTIPTQEMNKETHIIQQMNNVHFENTKLQVADHTARYCSSDVPLINNINKNNDDDDNNENASPIISSLTQAATGTSILDHLITNILVQHVNDPYCNEDNLIQHNIQHV